MKILTGNQWRTIRDSITKLQSDFRKDNEALKSEIDSLKRSIFKLENPPEFKYGDIVNVFYDKDRKEAIFYTGKIISSELITFFDFHIYHYTIDTGKAVKKIRSCYTIRLKSDK